MKAFWCRGNTQMLFHFGCCLVIWVGVYVLPFTDLMMNLTSIYEVLKMNILAWRQRWGFVCIKMQKWSCKKYKFFGMLKDRTWKIVWDWCLWRYIYCFHLRQPSFYTQRNPDMTIPEDYMYMYLQISSSLIPSSLNRCRKLQASSRFFLHWMSQVS